MSDAVTIPDEIAKRTACLINEAEDIRAQAVDDLKTIYGNLREELKALGWAGQNVSKEVAALKGAIAEMRLNEEKKAKREERGDRVDDYVSILSRSFARARARVRENTEKFDPDTGEILDDVAANSRRRTSGAMADHKKMSTLAREMGPITDEDHAENVELADRLAGKFGDATRSDGGLNIVTKHTEIATYEGGAKPDSVDMAQGSVPDLEPSGPVAERATNSPETAEGPKVLDGRSPVAGESRHQSDVSEDDAGQNLTGSQFTAKPPSPLRPRCRNPQACGGYGPNHCHSCTKTLEAAE